MTLARVDNAPCKKTGVFSLDLAEMRPVNVVTLLLCHLKPPLRYGGYLCNQIQQNNVEMCYPLAGRATFLSPTVHGRSDNIVVFP